MHAEPEVCPLLVQEQVPHFWEALVVALSILSIYTSLSHHSDAQWYDEEGDLHSVLFFLRKSFSIPTSLFVWRRPY